MTERPMCGNGDGHARSVPAVARVSWPGGPYRSTTACAGCRDWAFQEAASEVLAIRVDPIPEAYGRCPHCRSQVLLRKDGTLRAHPSFGGASTCEGRGKTPDGAS